MYMKETYRILCTVHDEIPLLPLISPHCSYSQNHLPSLEVQSKHHHEVVVVPSFLNSSSGKDQSDHQ